MKEHKQTNLRSHWLKSHWLKFHIGFTAVIGVLLLLNVLAASRFGQESGERPYVWSVPVFLGWFRTAGGWNAAIFLTIIGGYRIFWQAIRKAFDREISADLAIAIAAVAALLIKEYVAAAEVIFIMLVGEGLELFAADRTRSAIKKLLDLAPEQARLRRNGEERLVPIEEVSPGDAVVVRPGERIPIDGLVAKGRSSVDQSSITGESMPVTKEVGNEVFAGTMNGPGMLEIEVEAVGEDTKLAEIVHLVEEAEESKAPVQRRVDRYAKFFVPAVIAIALLTFFITKRMLGAGAAGSGATGSGTAHIIRAVAVLIVACPCALVLATPTAVVAALGRLARSGILVKGGVHLETMGEVDWVVFDKTGTLTLGQPKIAEIKAFGGATVAPATRRSGPAWTPEASADARAGSFGGAGCEAVLSLAAAAEQHSEHVLAELIVTEAKRRGLTVAEAEGFSPVPGLGVEAKLNGRQLLTGCRKLLEQKGVEIPQDAAEALDAMDQRGYTVVLVAHGERLVGAIGAEDTLREEARETVDHLKEAGIEHVSLLTGDNARVAAKIARQAGIRSYDADLLPGEKVAVIKRLQSAGHKVAMLGDGVNDAPSLATADVGIAMGGIGTDIAMEAADVIFMTDDLSRLAETIDVSRRAVATIKANIVWFALVFNIIGMAAAATGWMTPVIAAIIHQVGSLLVVLNSLRLLIAGRFHETWLGRGAARVVAFFHEDIPDASRRAWQRRLAIGRALIVLLLLAYAASGIYTVAPGEVGVERRFGKTVGAPNPPGLHYRLPWPMGRVDKVPVGRVHSLEVGFRTSPLLPGVKSAEPAAYEWNIRHTIGRYEKKIDEATMLTGDENLVETTLVVHYTIDDPVKYLFHLADINTCLLACAESAVRSVVSENDLVSLLATDRSKIEGMAAGRMQGSLKRYDCGIRIDRVLLQDVHPPLEVVSDFRAVSSAYEEKHRLVNEAEAYAAEQVELAKGKAIESLEGACAYQVDEENRAAGEAGYFECVAEAYARAPDVAALRLFLETAETALAPLRKVILDQRRKGKTELFWFDQQGILSKLKEVIKEEQPPAPTFTPVSERDEVVPPE